MTTSNEEVVRFFQRSHLRNKQEIEGPVALLVTGFEADTPSSSPDDASLGFRACCAPDLYAATCHALTLHFIMHTMPAWSSQCRILRAPQAFSYKDSPTLKAWYLECAAVDDKAGRSPEVEVGRGPAVLDPVASCDPGFVACALSGLHDGPCFAFPAAAPLGPEGVLAQGPEGADQCGFFVFWPRASLIDGRVR